MHSIEFRKASAVIDIDVDVDIDVVPVLVGVAGFVAASVAAISAIAVVASLAQALLLAAALPQCPGLCVLPV